MYIQCMDGCDSYLVNAMIGGDKPSTIIEPFDLEEEHYRFSRESSIPLERYLEAARLAGTDASNYCETGYTVLCESSDASYDSSG